MIDASASRLDIATQQLSDPRVVDAAILASDGRNVVVRTIVEQEYLFEADLAAGADPWSPHGRNEAARSAFVAMARAGLRIRSDYVGGALFHSNFVVASGGRPVDDVAVVTSANLTRSNLAHHFNALVTIRSPAVAQMLRSVFQGAWDGDFRNMERSVTVPLRDGGACTVLSGAEGSCLDATVGLIDGAVQSIELALFTLSIGNAGFDAIVRAIGRGVQVSGTVDGDQGGQVWDAVPALRASGARLRYVPGVLTGGGGRMHQKTLLVDGLRVAIGTGNLTVAAMESHESLVLLEPPAGALAWPVASFVRAELDRLFNLGVVAPPPHI